MDATCDPTKVSTRDEATEQLLRELQGSPTDLAKLVLRMAARRRTGVPISEAAIARWNTDDPDSWGRVRAWLTTRSVQPIIVA
jgi:hypothetical protein